MSPSSRGRGLKLTISFGDFYQLMSPSSRGRGLKLRLRQQECFPEGRPLHEGVD